jgi:hypothetical protein
MGIPTIATLFPALNEAAKTATGILQLVKDVDTKQKVMELQTTIMGLHDRIRTVQSEHEELERKLREYERWDAEAARYELRTLADGIFVYALKAEHKGSEPEHFLCPHCFGKRKRSILHHPGAGYTNYVCHACKFDVNPAKPSFAWASVNRGDRSRALLG